MKTIFYIRDETNENNFYSFEEQRFALNPRFRYCLKIEDFSDYDLLNEWGKTHIQKAWFIDYEYYCEFNDIWLYLESDEDAMLAKLRWL